MTTREQIDSADHKGADLFFDALTNFYDMSEWEALDMFARNGVLTVDRYIEFVRDIDLWELNPEHKSALEAFAPRYIEIGCSYATLQACTNKYDFIVVDTPQGIYPLADGSQVAEHFSLMPQLGKIMKDRCLIAFYVNKRPYDRNAVGDYGNDSYSSYDFQKWMKEREAFYGIQDGRFLFEDRAIAAYKAVFGRQGFFLKNVVMTPCYSFADGLPPSFRCALELERV